MLPNEVTRALREDPLGPLSVDDALLDVRRRVRASRVRTAGIALAAAAMVATVVVVPLVLKGSPEAGPAPAPDAVVPWSDRTDHERWEPPAPAPRSPGPACTAADLSLVRVDQDGAMQRTYSTVFLEKNTDGRCTLSGHAVLTSQRGTIPTSDTDAPPGGGLETPATIGRGEVARTTYTSVSMCASNPTGSGDDPVADHRDIALRLPDGSSIPLGRDLRSSCTPETTPYYFDNAPIEQPLRWPYLRATLELPESVEPGETLEYVVTLTNEGEEDVDLAPCGGFRQELAFEDMNTNQLAKPVVDEHRLNCDGDPVLAPGEARRYVMRLPVPRDALELAEARLTWQLVDDSPDNAGQGFVAVGTDPPVTAPITPPAELTGDWQELGPDGFLELRIGMDAKAALATGRISLGDGGNACRAFFLAMYGDGSGLPAHGYLRAGVELVAIIGQDEMHTPEGIRLGSTLADVRAAYPHLTGSPALLSAPAGDRTSYYFATRDGLVTGLGLARADDTCLAETIAG